MSCAAWALATSVARSTDLPTGVAVVVWVAAHLTRALLPLVLVLTLVSPAGAATVHCTTRENTIRQRWETLCDDGTRAISRWNATLERWETTITESPRQACTAQVNPITK